MNVSKADRENALVVRYNLRRILVQEPFCGDRMKLSKYLQREYNEVNKYLRGLTIIRFVVAKDMADKLNLDISEFYLLPPDDYDDAKWQIPNFFHEPSYKQRYEYLLQQYNEVLKQNQLKDETIAQLRFRIQQLENQQTPYMAAEPEN